MGASCGEFKSLCRAFEAGEEDKREGEEEEEHSRRRRDELSTGLPVVGIYFELFRQ
jgi:hypothetical protein